MNNNPRNNVYDFWGVPKNSKLNQSNLPTLRDDKKSIFNTAVEKATHSIPSSITQSSSPLGQSLGAAQDLGVGYINMTNHNLKSNPDDSAQGRTADNYYHCVANYDAAKRGPWGAKTAEYIGNLRENADYYHNRFKGMNKADALKDKQNDLTVNAYGRNQAVSCAKCGKYHSADEVCAIYKPSDFDATRYVK